MNDSGVNAMANSKAFPVSPGWKLILIDLGVNPENILRGASLPLDLFSQEKAALTTEEYFRFWSFVEVEGGQNLPIRLGSVLTAEAFDPAIFAALCSNNLNMALKRIATYKRLIAAMALKVDVLHDKTLLEIEWLDKTINPPITLVFFELVFFVQLSRLATRTHVRPLRVTSPLLPEDLLPYQDYFGVLPEQAEKLTIVFSAEDASRQFLTANEKMWNFFEGELKKRLIDLDEGVTTSERVKAALIELLPSGAASIDIVAKKLGTSTRTLQRRLKQEGRNFQGVLDQTREALAKHYLKTSRMTGSEISFLLGFEDPNSFFRAFNNWTGSTPEKTRTMFSLELNGFQRSS